MQNNFFNDVALQICPTLYTEKNRKLPISIINYLLDDVPSDKVSPIQGY